MKKILMLATLTVLAAACSSPKERYEERQADARSAYDESLKEAQEDYKEEELDGKKEQAQEMIEDGDAVNVNEDEGKIQVTE